METSEAVTALGALAQTTRLAIFGALAGVPRREVSAGALAEQLQVAPATLSFHLRELTRARLILARPEARFVYYSANLKAMRALIDFLAADLPPAPARRSRPPAVAPRPARKAASRSRPAERARR